MMPAHDHSIDGAVPGGDAPHHTTRHTLPNELLSIIFDFLDSPQPSSPVLRDEPTFTSTHARVADLKAISLVSKRWRQAILPILFRHARFTISTIETPLANPQQDIQPFLDFVTQASLRQDITTFTLLVQNEGAAEGQQSLDDSAAALWDFILGTIDPTELLIVAPTEVLGALTSCFFCMEDAWTLIAHINTFDSKCLPHIVVQRQR